MLPDDRLGSLAGASCPINGARQVCHSRPLERTSWNRLARGGVSIDQTSSGGRPKESSCVSIRGSPFVEVCQGSADRSGAVRRVPRRREAGVDDRRLHGRDAAPRRASYHTRSRRSRRRWRWTRRRTRWRPRIWRPRRWRPFRRVWRTPRRNKLRGTRRWWVQGGAYRPTAYWQGARRQRAYCGPFSWR